MAKKEKDAKRKAEEEGKRHKEKPKPITKDKRAKMNHGTWTNRTINPKDRMG